MTIAQLQAAVIQEWRFIFKQKTVHMCSLLALGPQKAIPCLSYIMVLVYKIGEP